MSLHRQKRFQQQNTFKKVFILALAFVLPIASLSVSYLIINAENLDTTESQASEDGVFTELMNFNSASNGNRSESSLIAMYNQWATVLYEDKNDTCTADGVDGDPKIKIRSYNVKTGESVQNENELGCLGGVNTPTAFRIVERDQTLVAFGSASNGNIYYTNIGGFRYGIWGGCEWGWNECTWKGATIVGVYDGESTSVHGEDKNNPKIVYTSGNQIRYTKYYGDGNVDWENKDSTGGYAQTRAITDSENVEFGGGTIVGNEAWVYRNQSNNKSVRIYGNLAAEKISPQATVSGIGGNTEVQGMVKNPGSNHVYLLGWKARGSQSEAANTEGLIYTVDASSKRAVHALSLNAISNIAQPKHPLIYNNKLYFVSGFVTDTRKGLYECPISSDGLVKTCNLKTLPAIDGKGNKNFITGLDRIGNNLYISVSVGDNGSTRLYEYTVDISNESTPTADPTGQPEPTADPTDTPPPGDAGGGEGRTPQCVNDPDPELASKTRRRISCSINVDTGAIDYDTCSNFSQFTLNNNYAGLDMKVTNPNTVIQSYLTAPIQGSQYRAYRSCTFNSDEGQLETCGQFYGRDISNGLQGNCGERYTSYSSYEFDIDGEDYTVMSYINTDNETLAVQVCPFNPNSGDIPDYNKCSTTPLDMSNLTGRGNERYKGYSSFMTDDDTLVQFFINMDNQVYNRVCTIEYSKNSQAGIDLRASSCSEFENITSKLRYNDADGNKEDFWQESDKTLGTLSPYMRKDGQYRFSFYAF